MYKFPDLWVCPFVNYGCDEWELEGGCASSAWKTEGGQPDALFYPRVKLGQLQENTTEERRIEAVYAFTDQDEDGNELEDVSVETHLPPFLPEWWCRSPY